MHKGLLLLGLILLALWAAPATAAGGGAATEKEAMPAGQEAATATNAATSAKKEAKPEGTEQALPEVVVESARLVEKQDQITIKAEGLPANVEVVTKEEIKRTAYTGNYAEILRKIPGVIVNNYASPVMGDRIGMRGFSGSHGRQVAVFVDGMPMNLNDYLHAYTDINWLVPEMIERIEVIKGPFSPLYGDFSLGGVINITTKKSDPSPSVGFYGGTYGTVRGVGVLSDSKLTPTPFLVWEGFTQNGYRDNSQYNRGQFFNKVTFPLWRGDLSVRAHYVARTWGSAGYLAIEDIKRGLRSRRSDINDTDKGNSEMADLVVNYGPKSGEEGLHASIYYAYHQVDHGTTNPPSPQSVQQGFEHLSGYKMLYNYLPFDCLSVIVGNELRYDQVSLNRWDSINYYTLTNQTRFYKYHQFTTGVFTQVQYKPFSFVKLVGGGRYDIFQIAVDNKFNPQNSGNCSPDLWSPKYGIVITPYKDINIFANKGRSFRSPDVTELSPYAANRNKNFSMGLAKLDSWDVGFNALLFNRLHLSFDYFDTRYQGEQVLNLSTQTYENLGLSKRTGIEVEAKFFITKELAIYGAWTDVRARLKNPTTPGQYYISGVPEDQAIVGLEFQKRWREQQLDLDFYYVRIGRNPQGSAGIVIASQFDQYFSKIAYKYKNWTASLDTVFTPRRYASDSYQLLNNQLVYVPLPQWQILGGLKYQF
jgi:outer membrane receptor protein involved in Fe transport